MSIAYAAPMLPRQYRQTDRPQNGDYFRCLAIAAWFASMVAIFWWQKDWYATIDPGTQRIAPLVFALGLCIAAAAHLTLGLPRLLASPYLPPFKGVPASLTVGFFILMLVLSPRSLTPVGSSRYAMLGWGTFCLCSWFWANHPTAFRRGMLLTSSLIIALLIALVLQHGFSHGSVGGINRNRFGSAAFVAVIMATFSGHWSKWILYAAGIGLIASVTSRSSIASTALFFGVFILFQYGLGKAVKIGIPLGLGLLGVILIARVQGGDRDPILDDLMHISDEVRGVDSGLTGRVERWKDGLKLFRLSPVVGYGFRSRTNESVETRSAHSGYINLLLDAGFIGAVIFLAAFVIDGIKRMNRVLKYRPFFHAKTLDEEQSFLYLVNCIALAVYAVTAALWIIEPIYLNFGHPLTAMFVLAATTPQLLETRAHS